MLAAPMTITSGRENKLDFIQPFSHVYITAIIQDPAVKEREYPYTPELKHLPNFDILKPFSSGVWCSVILFFLLVISMHKIKTFARALFMTSLCFQVWGFLALMNRYNPYESGHRVTSGIADESEDASTFDVTGSLMFTTSTLVMQGKSPQHNINIEYLYFQDFLF